MQDFFQANFQKYIFNNHLSDDGIAQFRSFIWEFYGSNARNFAWREYVTPYRVVVSEIMLQQTQTDRVAKKFGAFIQKFPSFEELAAASQAEVITSWQGLGYNRRALALHKIAKIIVQEYQGILPNDPKLLQTFPGIGLHTAGSICAFAYNMPAIFIETNIRTVFLYHFFRGQKQVHDKLLMILIAQTVDHENPRHWYYALMDYGVVLKKEFHNLINHQSRHHAVQSKFEGSERQIRGMILKILTKQKSVTFEDLCNLIDREPKRIEKNLHALCQEGFLEQENGVFSL
jgi:A/G-specific adenine glycosylase